MSQHFRLILIIGMLLLLMSSAQPLTAQDTEGLQPGLAMTKTAIAVYSEAKASSTKLAGVEPAELVTILKIEGPWAQIEYKDVTGWTRYAMGPTEFLINVSGPSPTPRGYHEMTYDSESDRVILFGGITGDLVWLTDTWAYEAGTNTWTKMAPAQSPPAGEGPLAYDIGSDRTIWFYGCNSTFDNPSSETWAYDLNSDSWTKMESAVAPPPLLGARMVYDTESDRIILFGGLIPASIATGFAYLNETWAYDYDTNTWTNMQPKISPPGMSYHVMAYHTGADRIFVMGMADLPTTEETWQYDYNTNTWEALKIAGPGARVYSAMVYDAAIDRLILFGQGEITLRNDTWGYDFDTNTWTELMKQSPLEGRGWHAMAYSPTADRVVLFGGGTSRQAVYMDTWLYDPNANTWTMVGP